MHRSSEATAGIERRRRERIPLSTPVLMRGHNSELQVGTCTDINEAGIGLDTEALFAVGEIIELEFMQDGKPVKARARIIYRQSQHYGVVFLDLAK